MARCIDGELDAYGAAVIGPLLSPEQCETLIHSYDNEELYRSRVVMARHGFGRGEYKYFAYPLPAVIAELRKCLYPYLGRIANGWNEAMGIDVRYPAEHEAFKARCHAAGQTKPTPQSNSPRRHGDTEKTEKKGLHGRPEQRRLKVNARPIRLVFIERLMSHFVIDSWAKVMLILPTFGYFGI